jgi:ribosome maturation factor RimP
LTEAVVVEQSERIAPSDHERKVIRVCEPVVVALGYDLTHLEIVSGARGGRIVRVYIDRPDSTLSKPSVTIDDCVRASRELDVVLDVDDVISGAYQLEVSSPGLDRPLGRKSDFDRFKGESARIETATPISGRRRWAGTLHGLVGDDVTIEVDGVVHAVPFSLIRKASLKYAFERDTAGTRP